MDTAVVQLVMYPVYAIRYRYPSTDGNEPSVKMNVTVKRQSRGIVLWCYVHGDVLYCVGIGCSFGNKLASLFIVGSTQGSDRTLTISQISRLQCEWVWLKYVWQDTERTNGHQYTFGKAQISVPFSSEIVGFRGYFFIPLLLQTNLTRYHRSPGLGQDDSAHESKSLETAVPNTGYGLWYETRISHSARRVISTFQNQWIRRTGCGVLPPECDRNDLRQAPSTSWLNVL